MVNIKSKLKPKVMFRSCHIRHVGFFGHIFHTFKPVPLGITTLGYREVSSSKSYYDTLEVTPKASAAQIKAAYYRLSKKYHPDVNSDSGARHKFSMLSEAYEILGNRRNRALYDRGMLNPSNISVSHQSASDVDMEYEEFLKRRSGFRKKSDIPTGRTETYNFDEFYRQHYGESIKQSQQDKEERAKHEEYLQRRLDYEKRNAAIYMALLIGSALLYAFKKLK